MGDRLSITPQVRSELEWKASNQNIFQSFQYNFHIKIVKIDDDGDNYKYEANEASMLWELSLKLPFRQLEVIEWSKSTSILTDIITVQTRINVEWDWIQDDVF